jgi:hypothetical protein
MKNFIINELRKCSTIPGKQKTWVSELSDEQLYQLYKRLLNGENAKSIARYVQKSWNVKPNSTVHSVSQGILKFRKRISLLLEESKSDSIVRNQPEYTELDSPNRHILVCSTFHSISKPDRSLSNLLKLHSECSMENLIDVLWAVVNGDVSKIVKSQEFNNYI